MTFLRWAALSLIWLVGIATIIGSSLEEERPPPPPPVPVNVQFDLSSGNFRRALTTRTAVLSDLLLTGSYSANQGNQLTLNRSSIVLDSGSGFRINISGSGNELLIGQSVIDISAALDIGLAHNPTAGQFSSLFSSTTTTTTTIVTVTASGVSVQIGGATSATAFSWNNFIAAESDANASLNLRMASAAYNMFGVVLRAARLAEDIVGDIESNKTTLQTMGTNSGLALDCDNSATAGASQTLFWSSDAIGTGQGVIGDGDAFEARFNTCQDASRSHFLDGTADLTQYNPADTTGLSTFGVTTELSALYFSDAEINRATITPTAATPRYNGMFSITLRELAL